MYVELAAITATSKLLSWLLFLSQVTADEIYVWFTSKWIAEI